MKKYLSYILLLVFISACSKGSSNTNPLTGKIDVTVSGQNYSTGNFVNIGGTGYSNYTSCDNKISFLQLGNEIETSNFRLSVYIFNYQNDKDFSNTKAGPYRLVDMNKYGLSFYGSICSKNMDIEVSLLDKTQSNTTCTLSSTGLTNSVSQIQLIESNSISKTYLVSGTFTCTFINAVSKSIPITSNYSVFVKVLI